MSLTVFVTWLLLAVLVVAVAIVTVAIVDLARPQPAARHRKK